MIRLWWRDGCWHAASDDPERGVVGGSIDVVIATVKEWMAATSQRNEQT